MAEVCMYQSATKEAIDLSATNRRRIKNKLIQKLMIVEGNKRNNACGNDYNESDRDIHSVNLNYL